MEATELGRSAVDYIMVGFDGTRSSFIAMDWAAERAARGPCRVEIVRVDSAGLMAEDVEGSASDAAERRLRDIAPDAEVTSRTVPGRMPGALLRAAGAADLLVIGEPRRRPLRTALTGWRPLRAASQSTVPTVVVPDDWEGAEGPVLVGVDDDDSSVAAVEFAAAEAVAAGLGLTLLHAWQLPAPTMEGAVALLASPIAEKARHRRILEEAHAYVTEAYPSLNIQKVLRQDDPAPALLATAARSSLLVLGTHHREVFAGTFLGSVGQDVLLASRIPVCVVPQSRVLVGALSRECAGRLRQWSGRSRHFQGTDARWV